jgi:anti-sigma factor RsiW
MSKRPYDDQAITRYLLGSLPEAEAERLDELSFTDDEFAESLEAAEKDLVDAYVQGELSGAALEQFKSHYLASPLRRERVKFAQAFHLLAERQAAAQVAEVSAEKPAVAKRKGPGWFSALSALAAPRPALQWGAALAALALLVLGAPSNTFRPPANGISVSASPWMTSSGPRYRARWSEVAKR